MAFSLIQAGTSLQFLNTSGGIITLTLPPGVSLNASLSPRWIVYGNYVILVNSPNFPLTIDANGDVRPLTPKAPGSGPVLSAGSAGDLTGTYGYVRYTFIIRDSNGNLISESDFSPGSNTITIANKMLRVDGIETSTDTAITGRRIYRTTNNGVVLFPWMELDGNTLTSFQDDLSDAGLQLIAAPTLGSVPRLLLIKEWRNRLWGVGDTDLDNLRFSQAEAMWSWPITNGIKIPGIGRDQFGIKALMPRREALGVGRRDLIWQITGQTPEDFTAVKLSEVIGVESQESVVTYRDTIWWLWKDGVYQWDDDGLVNVSDGHVKSWFSTDNYFNRNMFVNSFAVFDPIRLKYKLYLASAGSNKINRWVEYDIVDQTWWGPHRTRAFSESSAFLLTDIEDKQEAVVGSSLGFIWKERLTATDNIEDGIPLSLITKWFDGSLPDYEKYWGQLSVLGKVQGAGIVAITPRTGYLDSTDKTPLLYDMTKGRQKLDRLGTGKLMQLTFTHDDPDEPVELYGLELPYTVIGHR